MNARTCRFVAVEHEPDTIARRPVARGNWLAAFEGVIPKFAGNPIATPEPAVTSGMSFRRGSEAHEIVVRHGVDDRDGDACRAAARRTARGSRPAPRATTR
jgi:hypothetical protein